MKQKQFNHMMCGILLIVIAIGIFGKVFSWWNLSLKENWSLLFVFIFAFMMIWNKLSVISTVGFIISLIFYLNGRGMWSSVSVRYMVPTICLLVIGLNLVLRGLVGTMQRNTELYKKEDFYGATFSSIEAVPYQKEFKGCKMDAVFGGTNLDLRDATFSGNVQIDVTVLFGGVHLIVPQGVCVKKNVMTIFGNVSDQRNCNNHDGKTTIYLNGICMFGGVEIK